MGLYSLVFHHRRKQKERDHPKVHKMSTVCSGCPDTTVSRLCIFSLINVGDKAQSGKRMAVGSRGFSMYCCLLSQRSCQSSLVDPTVWCKYYQKKQKNNHRKKIYSNKVSWICSRDNPWYSVGIWNRCLCMSSLCVCHYIIISFHYSK